MVLNSTMTEETIATNICMYWKVAAPTDFQLFRKSLVGFSPIEPIFHWLKNGQTYRIQLKNDPTPGASRHPSLPVTPTPPPSTTATADTRGSDHTKKPNADSTTNRQGPKPHQSRKNLHGQSGRSRSQSPRNAAASALIGRGRSRERYHQRNRGHDLYRAQWDDPSDHSTGLRRDHQPRDNLFQRTSGYRPQDDGPPRGDNHGRHRPQHDVLSNRSTGPKRDRVPRGDNYDSYRPQYNDGPNRLIGDERDRRPSGDLFQRITGLQLDPDNDRDRNQTLRLTGDERDCRTANDRSRMPPPAAPTRNRSRSPARSQYRQNPRPRSPRGSSHSQKDQSARRPAKDPHVEYVDTNKPHCM